MFPIGCLDMKIAHCIVQIINEQNAQECDATMFNSYSIVWFKKNSLFTIDYSPHHSVLKLFTGFAIAALIAWKLIVTPVITIAITPAITNTNGFIIIL